MRDVLGGRLHDWTLLVMHKAWRPHIPHHGEDVLPDRSTYLLPVLGLCHHDKSLMLSSILAARISELEPNNRFDMSFATC